MKRSIGIIDLPTDCREFEIELPRNAVIRHPFMSLRPPTALLVRPGTEPQPTLVPCCVLEFELDAELVRRKFLVLPAGQGVDVGDERNLEYVASFVHELLPTVIVLFEVRDRLGRCLECGVRDGAWHMDGCRFGASQPGNSGTELLTALDEARQRLRDEGVVISAKEWLGEDESDEITETKRIRPPMPVAAEDAS